MSMDTYGIIGFAPDNVGIDRRIYTGSAINGQTDPILAVSYNGGRVDVYLNGIKLVGDHSEMPSGTRDYTFTQTGQGSSIQLRTNVALVSADVVECVGHVGLGSNVVTSYNPTPANTDGGFNVFASINHTTSDLVNVFLNGVLLDDSDYTLDAGNNKVTILGATLTASDVVVIQVIGALDNSNFVSASGGTFTGNVVFSGNTTGVDVNGTELVLDADGDTSITADTDDRIDFKTAGTDRVHIDSSGKILTGITSADTIRAGVPQVQVEGVGYADSSISAFSNSNDGNGAYLFLGKSRGTSVGSDTIINDGDFVGGVEFIAADGTDRASTTGGVYGVIDGTPGANDTPGSLRFYTTADGSNAATERMRIRAGGDVEVKTGNLVIGTAGKGIDFAVNSTENVSSASNVGKVLMDFEEGEFSPAITGESGSSSGLSATRKGYYTRIGDIVHVTIFIQNSSWTSGPSGTAYIGLPFTVKANFSSAGTIGYVNNFTKTPQRINAFQNTAKLYLFKYNTSSVADNSGFTNLDGSEVNSNSEIYAQVTYRVA